MDKVFWLVGSGFFYGHSEIGRLTTDRDEFITHTLRELDEANDQRDSARAS